MRLYKDGTRIKYSLMACVGEYMYDTKNKHQIKRDDHVTGGGSFCKGYGKLWIIDPVENYVTLVENEMEYKVGDSVKVIKNLWDLSSVEIGKEYKVINVSDKGVDVDNGNATLMLFKEVEKVDEDENENYIMIEGKKVSLSEDTVREFKEKFVKEKRYGLGSFFKYEDLIFQLTECIHDRICVGMTLTKIRGYFDHGYTESYTIVKINEKLTLEEISDTFDTYDDLEPCTAKEVFK